MIVDKKDQKIALPFNQARKPQPTKTFKSGSISSMNQEIHIDFDDLGNPYFRDLDNRIPNFLKKS